MGDSMRKTALFGGIVALVAAQTASAAPLNAPKSHIDPLLSLSMLASAHSRTIVCQQGEVNCAQGQAANGAVESGSVASAAAAHAGLSVALALVGAAGLVGLAVAMSGGSHGGHAVSPF